MTRLNLFSPCKVCYYLSSDDWLLLLCFGLRLVHMFAMQINVFLRITGKRPDGFHDLASLFHVSISVPVLFFSCMSVFLKNVFCQFIWHLAFINGVLPVRKKTFETFQEEKKCLLCSNIGIDFVCSNLEYIRDSTH